MTISLTLTLTRAKLAVLVVIAALSVPAAAIAAQAFDDVEPGAFYVASVGWASENGITTGTSETTFAPNAEVTRGEAVTFLKRYHDNVVAPVQSDLQDSIDTNAADGASTAADLAEHASHLTTHFVVVSPAGVHTSSYPGASSVEFATGVYHIDLPGLEVYDWDEGLVLCDLQSNSLNSEGLRVTGATFNDDVPRDEFQLIVWSTDIDGILGDDAVSLLVTC